MYLKKVKFSRYGPGVAQRAGRSIALLFRDRGTRRGEWSASHPGRTLLPGKTRYPKYKSLCGSQVQSRRAENLVPTDIIKDIFKAHNVEHTVILRLYTSIILL